MHFIRRQLLLAPLTLAMVLGLAHADAAPTVDQTLAAIAKQRLKTKTLRADFSQTRVLGLLASEVKSQGRLMVQRPHRLRWELKSPDSVVYWVGPEGLAVQSAEGVKKVSRAAAGRFATALMDMIHFVAGDMKSLKARYTFRVRSDKKQLELQAVPKSARLRKQIAQISLWMPSNALWRVNRISIRESSGDRSDIVFRNFQKNVKLRRRDMTPPPKG